MTKSDQRLTLARGDIVWLNCDPSVGVEPQKIRTCVIVSNDIANRFGQAVTVVPTQQHTAARAARAYMVDLRSSRSTLCEKRVANCSMVMSYDRARVVKLAGRVSPETLQQLGEALALHLGLDS
jgi:mRNA interferase MazF